MAPDEADRPDVLESTVRSVDDDEYELAAVAVATLDGPAGAFRLRRRYQGLPRHNDVVAPSAVDSNDELLARPDAVHVHTRCYDGEEYLTDVHDTFVPEDPGALESADAFVAACRAHHDDTRAAAYAAALAERD